MKIGFLTPSRDRPDDLLKYINSVKQYATAPEETFFYCYIDSDDPQLDKYKLLLDNEENVIIHVGFPHSISKSWNVIARMAYNDGCDMLAMGNDDLIFISPWQDELYRFVSQIKDQIYCCWFDDGIDEAVCNFPIVSRRWFEILGYFTPEIFLFAANDTWIYDISNRINRAFYLSNVKTQHLHRRQNILEKDDLALTVEAKYDFDKLIYRQFEPIRVLHAKKLQQYCKVNYKLNQS